MDTTTQHPTPAAAIMRSSSIALLQERFRQLERAREMRQQREFFRFFAEAEQVQLAATTTLGYEPPHEFSHPELLFPSKQQPLITPQKPMKGQCNFDLQVREIPDLTNLRSSNLLLMQTRCNYFDESDVDTSLHL